MNTYKILSDLASVGDGAVEIVLATDNDCNGLPKPWRYFAVYTETRMLTSGLVEKWLLNESHAKAKYILLSDSEKALYTFERYLSGKLH